MHQPKRSIFLPQLRYRIIGYKFDFFEFVLLSTPGSVTTHLWSGTVVTLSPLLIFY